jgi:hypothetical protein
LALDKGTEFGKFAHWLAADYLVMATATPKDQRLTEFWPTRATARKSTLPPAATKVVQARLNKKYIEAVVYSLGSTMAQVTDLRRTVLRQAWASQCVDWRAALPPRAWPAYRCCWCKWPTASELWTKPPMSLMRLCGMCRPRPLANTRR